MWDASDDTVVAAVAAGDETAIAVLVRRFQRPVYGLALTVVRDEGHAADVAQETFVRAWRHAASFDPRRGSVRTWLLAICRNLAIDHLRMENVRPAEPIDPTLIVRRTHDVPPDESAIVDVETARVLRALAELSDEQRRSVVLATIGGLTAREISDVEHIPLGTAKTRVRDGLQRARRLLDVGPGPDVGARESGEEERS